MAAPKQQFRFVSHKAKRKLGALFFLVFFAFLGSVAAAASGFPIAQGDVLGEGWVVGELTRHPEFIRFSLARNSQRTEIEVTFHQGPPGEWETRHYRIQPAPNAKPPEALLHAVKERIARFEESAQAEEAAPLVTKIRRPERLSPPPPQDEANWLVPTLLLALSALLGLALAFAKPRAKALGATLFRCRLAFFYAFMLVATCGILEAICLVAENTLLPYSNSTLSCLACLPPPPPPKAPGEYRVFLFGESTVAGFLKDMNALNLEAQLRHGLEATFPSKEIRVYNYGMGGIDPARLVARFRHLAEQGRPDLAIVMLGQNYTYGDGYEVNAVDELAEATALTRTLRRFYRRLRGVLREREFPNRIAAARARYPEAIDALRRSAAQNGLRLALCTMAANLRDWAPGSPPYLSLEDERLRTQWVRGDAKEAERQALERFERQPSTNDATLLFLAGRASAQRGEKEKAWALLVRAKDTDPSAGRITDAMNAYVRGQNGKPGLLVVDVEQAFRAHSADELIGQELIGDHCHPSPLGYSLMVRAILARLSESGWLGQASEAGLAKAELSAYEAELPAKELREAQANYHFGQSEFCLYACTRSQDAPGTGQTAACPYLAMADWHGQNAEKIAPQDWRLRFLRAITFALQGRAQESRDALAQAAKLRGKAITRDDFADDTRMLYLLDNGVRPAGWRE